MALPNGFLLLKERELDRDSGHGFKRCPQPHPFPASRRQLLRVLPPVFPQARYTCVNPPTISRIIRCPWECV